MPPLRWLDFGFNVIAIHPWFVTGCEVFEQIWIAVNIYRAMAMRRCYCLNLAILKQSSLPHVSCLNHLKDYLSWGERCTKVFLDYATLSLLKIYQFLYNLRCGIFRCRMPKPSVKIAWHEPNIISNLFNSELAIIQILSFNASMFSLVTGHFKCFYPFNLIFNTKLNRASLVPFFEQ